MLVNISSDTPSSNILGYESVLTNMFMMYKTFDRSQIETYNFPYDVDRQAITFIMNHADYLEPLLIRKLRVECKLNDIKIAAEMKASKKKHGFQMLMMDYVDYLKPEFMKRFNIQAIKKDSEYKEELANADIDSIHIKRLLHEDFPNLPYGFDETQPWPVISGARINPATVP